MSASAIQPNRKGFWSTRGGLLFAWVGLSSLVVFRDAGLIASPRLWAEEAIVYYNYAVHHSFFETITLVVAGYLSILTNVAAYLASRVPTEHAPVVTTAFSALVQLGILSMVCWGGLSFLKSTKEKILAGAVVSFIGMTGAIWLNTITLQYQLPLLTCFILLDDKEQLSRRRRVTYYALALVCGLNGVTSCILTPLFALRYWRRRQRADLILFGCLAVACAIQLTCMVVSATQLAHRFAAGPDSMGRLLYYLFAYPIVPSIVPNDGQAWLVIGVLPLLARLAVNQEYRLYLCAYAVCVVLPFVGSVGMLGGARYAYAAAVVLNLLFVRVALDRAEVPWLRWICGGLMTVSLCTGITVYKQGWQVYSNPAWPSWREEVSQWRANPRHWLAVHPAHVGPMRVTWRFRLTPDDLHEASQNGTPAALIQESSIHLPVVRVPWMGNIELDLQRSGGEPGEWRSKGFSFIGDDLFPMGEFDFNMSELSFVDDKSVVRRFRVTSASETYELTYQEIRE